MKEMQKERLLWAAEAREQRLAQMWCQDFSIKSVLCDKVRE